MRRALLVLVFAAVTGCTGGESGSANDALASDVGSEADATKADAAETVDPTCRLLRTWETWPVGDLHCGTYTYDERGLLVLLAGDPDCDGDFDDDGDGNAGGCTRFTYDAEGRRLTIVSDRECKGTRLSGCLSWIYDDAIHQITEIENGDCLDPPDFVRTRTYDDHDRLVREQVQESPETGAALYCYEYTYDASGNVLETRQDDGCDGTGDYCQRAAFDASGSPISSGADDGCDGVPDRNCRTITIVSEANGDTTNTQRLDRACDGSDLLCSEARMNARGDFTWNEVDEGCDGVGESCVEHVFDENGGLLAMKVAVPCGATPKVCANAYVLNAAGFKVSSQDDPECTGVAGNCVTTGYDDAGRIVEQTVDLFCNGNDLTCTRFEYDAHGNQVLKRTETPCGGDYFGEEHAEYACGE